jgi:hypothetical protein
MENIKQNFIQNCKLSDIKKCNSFFSDDFIKFVNDELNTIFPILNTSQKEKIVEMLLSLLTLIFFKFNFVSVEEFYTKLNQNNNQDLKMIIFLLFPYMKDDNDFEIHKNLTILSDLGLKKVNNKYITNIQYDLYDNNNKKEFEFSLNDIYSNYIASYYTIYKCANHLYCNWSQVIPYTLNNYRNSKLYQETIDFISENTYKDSYFFTQREYHRGLINQEYIEEYTKNITNGGLDIRDFYHAFINDLYLDVLPYKWLLYEMYESVDKCYISELFTYFGFIFNIKDEPDTIEKNENTFKLLWNKLTGLISVNQFYHDLVYQILVHFDIKSTEFLNEAQLKIHKKVLNVVNYDKIEEYDDIVLYDETKKEEDFKKLLESYNNDDCIKPLYIYLVTTIHKFSFTWYGKLMLGSNDSGKFTKCTLLKDIEFNGVQLFNVKLIESSYISYKNIYNFIKSLLILDGKVYKVNDWDSLSSDMRDEILDRLNDNLGNWFNIRGNLRKRYNNNYRGSYPAIQDTIFNTIKDNLIDLVFHVLITRGILTQFKTNISEKERIESYDGFYFITQKKYTELPTYTIINNGSINTGSFTTYINDNIKDENAWFNRFSADWVQQIHFFKHFFNQRLMFVTGSTGVGKSTQIPKLLLYGLHLMGNYKGNVICTQPRINATKNAASQISFELGLPIFVYNSESKKEDKSDNYYIQYTTEADKHGTDVMNKKNIPDIPSVLKIVTDGTLLNIIKKSPFLKVDINYNSKTIYSPHNSYDIIAVDEAHEHNSNMDIILTLMRDTIQLNNSLKLIIISATIDDDEPRYRRYYKNIDDRYIYPIQYTHISQGFNNKFIDNSVKYSSKKEIDRRLHLSKPGTSTLFKINDIYTKEDTTTYEEAESQGYEKVFEITKNPSGDILFFSTSKNKILDIVTRLNNDSKLPSNWIALPYYREIPKAELYRTIDQLTVSRKYIFDYINNNKSISSVSKGTYTRFILVSTNIAEASITINTLTHVIDTGYVISVSYNVLLNVIENKPVQISESSRIQRRGRIGRVQNGTIYYMYKENARKNNTIKYPITLKLDDLIYNLCDLITTGYYDSETNEIQQSDIFLMKYISANGYNELPEYLVHQYYLDIKNEQIIRIIPTNRYTFYFRGNNGYFLPEITDFLGEFYLIHPFENEFERDEFSGLIIYSAESQRKVNKMYNILFNQLFKLRLITIDYNAFIKTELWTKMNELKLNLSKFKQNLNYNEIWSLILGAKYNILDEIFWITCVLQNSSLSAISRKKTTNKGYEIPDTELMMSNFGNKNSDLIVYLNIFNKLKLVLPKLDEFTIDELKTQKLLLDRDIISSLGQDDYKILINFEKKSSQLINDIVCYKNIDTINYRDNLKKWCVYYGLDYLSIRTLTKKYYEIKRIYKIIYNWVIENNNYIPEILLNTVSNNTKVQYIYISTYSDLNNIDDRKDIKSVKLDKYSMVNSEYIHVLVKDKKDINNNFNTSVPVIEGKHMSYFNYSEHSSAIIPSLLYYLNRDMLPRNISYLLYKNITPSMLEKYLLPDTNKNNIAYNQQLLTLFELLRKASS